MRRIILLVLLGWVCVGRLNAQAEADPQRADSLRVRIQERFARVVQEQLGLTDDQAAKMRTTALSWFSKRRNLDAEERRLRGALAAQMRPGVSADQDSVATLTDALLTLQITQVQSYRDELKEMSYLTPVQRAQFFILRDRLLKRIEEARDEPRPERGRLRQRR
ncbi:MAG: Spy/CpxP family protein refolding chaperone [Gemmatimonadota bacterium]